MNTTVPTSSKLFKTAASAGKIMMLVFGFLLVFGNKAKAQASIPATQTSNIVISGVTGTTATLNWTPGSGAKRDVFVFQGSTFTAPSLPTGVGGSINYSAPSPGVYDVVNDSQVAGTPTGWYCVLSASTASGVTVTNLTAGTPYQVLVVEYNTTPPSHANYNTTITSGNTLGFSTSNANANLTNLTASAGGALTLTQSGTSPSSTAFASGVSSYTASVPNATTGMTVNATLADLVNVGTITLTANGITIGSLTSGSDSPTIPLNPGSNTILVKITSSDFSTNFTYTLTVTRVGSTVSTLNNLVLSSGGLSPPFPTGTPTGTSSYTAAAVPGATTFVTVTPTFTDATATATVAVNGTSAGAVTNNTASPNLNLNVGSNSIVLTVTAQDGVTVNTFTISIVRQSNIATLASLVPSSGSLSPAYVAGTGTSSYTITVPNATTSLSLTPTLTDPTAGIFATLDGGTPAAVTSGSPTASLSLVTGSANTFSIKVTSQDGSVVDFYTVTVTRQSNIGTLASLTTTPSTTFTPTFTAGATTGSYSTSVPNGTGSITITPTATDPTATITVNGTPIASGSTTLPISLNTGPNTETVVVTSQDLTVVNTYTLNVTELSNVASLSALTLTSPATSLSPTFATGTFSYNASVAPGTPSIVVTPTSNAFGTITVQDGVGTPATVASGSPSLALPLVSGNNTITVTVTSSDGSTPQAYTIIVNAPAASSVATLASLTTSPSFSLSPSFASGTFGYTGTVPINTTSMTVTPTADPTYHSITVSVNPGLIAGGTPNPVTSGSPSGALALAVGANTVTIVVTAQDGVTKDTYTLTVTRPAASTVATLSSIGLSVGSLSPTFASGTNNYSVSETALSSPITITPTATNASYQSITYSVNGGTATSVTSGSPTGTISFSAGVPILVTIVVTAQDGVTTDTYNLSIGAPPATGEQLSSLTITGQTIAPTFSATTDAYNLSVPFATTSATVNFTIAASSGPTAKVNGTTVTLTGGGKNGTATVSLGVGLTTITIAITNSGVTGSYVIAVTRAAASTNALLSNLTVAAPATTLSPTFGSGITSYTTTIPNASTSIAITATDADATATLKVNGVTTTSGSARTVTGLAVGTTTIPVVVTAQDGVTTQTYNIAVTRVSNDATLSALTVSAGTLSPVFASATTGYSTSVPNGTTSITITPTVNNAFATVKVNGTTTTSGTGVLISTLVTGNNPIPVVVTAQDGTTTDTYTVNVIVQSGVASLSALTISAGTLTPGFTTGNTAYTDIVPFANSTVTVTPTSSLAGTITVQVNSGAVVPVTSGVASSALSLSNTGLTTNLIAIVVTSSDGLQHLEYDITVTRQSNVATLSSLALTGLATPLTPTFAPGTFTYSASVLAGTTSTTITPTLTDGTATLKVNGTTTTSGTPVTINGLVAGVNPVTVAVTSQDLSVIDTYTVNVIVQSNIASLSNLVLSTGALVPPFSTGQMSYTQTVPFTTNSVTVTPTTNAGGTVTVNGTAVNSGSASAAIGLPVGNTTITVAVLSSDGTTPATYTVVVTRTAPSNVNTLSNLQISGAGALSPAFATGTTNYVVNETSATSITVTPTVTDPTSTVTVNGVTVTSGTASGAQTLTTGIVTIIPVTITAQSGATNTYNINVGVTPGSSNAELSGLTTTAGALTPNFAAASISYNTPAVPFTTSTVTVTPLYSGSGQGITNLDVNGNAASVTGLGGGTASGPLSLTNTGSTPNIIHITAKSSGGTTGIYSIYVTRTAPSSDATIATLVTNPTTTFTPGFTPGGTSYTATINAASFTVTPTFTSGIGTYSVNGATAVASGVASAAIPLTIGTNPVTIVTTAQDGTTTKTYNFTITRLSNIATLSSLTTTAGTFAPGFASGTNSYSVTVLAGTPSTTVTAAVTDPTATMTVAVNGSSPVTLPPNTSSASLPLNNGNNPITVVVTAQDGTTINTYTLNVIVPANIALLSNIVPSSGTLSPTFNQSTQPYTETIPFAGAAAFTLTPTSQAAGTITVQLNSGALVPVASGAASAPFALTVAGPNVFTIVVTSSDATANFSYSVTVTVTAPSNISTLNNLTTTPATTFTPTFAIGTTVYATSVPFTTTALTFNPTLTDPTATVLVNGASAATPVSLTAGGVTNVNVVVTAQDGVTKTTYSVAVTRAAPSTTATLSGITFATTGGSGTAGALTPTFASGTLNYVVNDPNGLTAVSVTPTVTDPNSTIKVNGTTVASGAASGSITLTSGGVVPVTIVVTAQDGVTTNTYTINVGETGTFAQITGLTISQGTLSPAFNSSDQAFTDNVPFATSSLTVTPTVSFGTVTVNGTAVTSGSASGSISLTPGNNTITVTGSLGSSTVILVNRAAPSSNATIATLTTSPTITFSPPFASGTLSGYTATTGAASFTVTPTLTAGVGIGTYSVNGATAISSGTASAAIPLSLGSNPITIIATAQDGVTTATYSFTITRLNNVSTLSSLVPSSGAIAPTFAAGTTSYTETVPATTTSFFVTPSVTDPNATIKVNGVTVASGSGSTPLTLVAGNNTFTTIVTAQDGVTTTTYTLVVLQQSAIASLASLTTTPGITFTPTFSTGVTSGYTGTVPFANASITVTPTSNAGGTITVAVNSGTANTVASGVASGPLSLNPGANTIVVTVTSTDNSLSTPYTFTVTRSAASTVATLASITPSGGVALSPTFNAATTTYIIDETSTTTRTFTPVLSDLTATMTVSVNGGTATALASGAPVTATVPASGGIDVLTFVVTAQDGVTKVTYTVNVGYPNSQGSSSSVTALTISSPAGTVLSPVFSNSTQASIYTTSVPVGTTSATVNFTNSSTSATATIAVNGGTATSVTLTNVGGSNTGAPVVTIGPGLNTITLAITRSGTTGVYTIFVNNPAITTAGTPVALNTVTQTASTPTSFTVSGTNLLGNITVTAPAGSPFQVSATSGGTYSNTFNITQSGGNVTSVPVFVRLAAADLPGNYTGNIQLTSGVSATEVDVAIPSSTVTFIPQTITFNPIAPQTYGVADLSAATSTNNGIAITYVFGTPGVASIVSGKIHLLGIGTTTITASQAGDATHSAATSVQQTLTVNQAALTITATAGQSKVYGATDPTLTYSITSGALANGDQITGSLVRDPGENVGTTYAITQGTLTAGPNYAITYVGANFAITTAPLTITATAGQGKVYGTSDPGSLTYSITSGALVGTDAITGSLVRAPGETVGNYAITQGTLTAGTNYAITYVGANFAITTAPLTITATAGQGKVYGTVDPALTYSITSGALVGTDAITGSLVRAPGENVGTTYAITQGTLTAGTNYAITYVGANFAITTAPLTITATAGQSKVYGTVDPALTYSITSGALVGTDAITGSLARDPGENVGTTYAITQGTLTAGTNYAITYVGANFAITTAPLTITATAGQSKVYGTVDPALTYSITSGALVGTDAITGSLARDPGENVGTTYAITQGTLTAGTNYAITYVGANFAITTAPLTITATAGQGKVYGTSDPGSLTYSITSGALVGTDAITGSLVRAPGETVGNYAISQGTLTAGTNYAITYVGANFAITTAPLTITATAGQGKVYGTVDPALTYSITSGALVGTDAITGSLVRAPGEAVGTTYAITQGTLTAGTNYAITYVGANFAITTAPLTITATAGQSKVYGTVDPALTYSITSGALVGTDAITGSLVRAPGEAVGTTYAITQGTLTAGTNYAITYVGANFAITTAPLTITATAGQGKVYGTVDPALTYSITSGALVGTDAITGSLVRAPGEAVGTTYAITQGTLTAGTNYAITYVGANFAITTAPLTITATAGQGKVYGTVDPALTYSITSGALVGTDAITGSLARDPGENVGTTYAITQGTLTAGTNYAITYVGANFAITTAPLTITATAGQGKVYGTVDPTLTYSITSGALVGTDAITGSLARDPGENVGTTYAITQGTLTAGTNYAITYVGANFAITTAPLTITATAGQGKVYGTVDPALTYSITSGALVGTDAITGSLVRAPGEAVGTTYAITQGTLTAGTNYAITYVGANFAITTAPLTITATAGQGKVYGTVDPTLTYSITSGALVGTDAITGSLVRAPGENVGTTYAITQGTLTAGTNYAITYVGANFAITTAPLTITATAGQGKVYGTVDPTLTYSITSGALVGTDAITGSLVRDPGENVGTTYAITQGTLTAGTNYAITYVGANFAITTAPLTITATAGQGKVYGTSDPGSLTYSITSGALVGTDAITGSLVRAPGETVGNYAITQGTLTAGTNYAITYVGANFAITTAPLTITATAGQGKVYGTVDPALTYSITSGALVGTDAITGSLVRAPGEAVGTTYAITQGTLTAGTNYAITYVGANFAITTAPLTITATAGQGKVYGTVDPALTYSITSGALVGTDAITGSLVRAPGEAVGTTYAITQGTLTAGTNYAITYVGANFAITTAPLTITATAGQGKVYGTVDPTLTYSITSGALVGTDAITGSLVRAPGENVGTTYAITQGTLTAGTNYAITYVGANFAITTAPLTITATAGQGKVYGTVDPTLTYSITSGALVGTDAITGSLVRAPGENVGTTYAITQGTLTAGTNYAITYVGANFAITTAPLTITATAGQSKVYGTVDPALTYSITSGALVGTDAITGSLVRAPGETVGNYAISQGTLTAGTNYAITYVGANFAITQAPLTIFANNVNKTYGATLTGGSSTAFTAPALLNGETIGSVTIAYGSGAAATDPVATYTGSVTVTPGSATGGTFTASNYNISYTAGNIIVGASSDGTLSSLATSVGTLSPSFSSGVTSYTTSVSNTTATITVTPTTSNIGATIKVNGSTVASGSASSPIAIAAGTTTNINVVVTPQDNSTPVTYTIGVARPTTSNANLSTLVLTPASALTNTGTVGTTTSYTTSVPNATASVTVTPTTQDPAATIKVNGVTVASGTASGSITLPVGTTTITTVVTAQDLVTTHTYSIAVTRAPSSNAALTSIALTPASTLVTVGTVGTTTTYTATAANATTSVTVTPTTQDPTATVKVGGVTVASGTPSASIALGAEGSSTTITTIVTAQDGSTTHTYSIIVTRAPSSVATLSVIKLTPSATLTNTGTVGTTTSYTTTAANATTSVTVTPTVTDANATVKVNGTTVASGVASGSLALGTEGSTTTITIVVTAQDGTTTHTYSIAVTRAPSSDATLTNLVPNSGSLAPAFASATKVYTESVPNATANISLTPTTHDANAVVTVSANGVTNTVASGTASPAIFLTEGVNTLITTTVLAQDGTTTASYTLTVSRAASSDATLSSLVSSGGSLSPTFASATISYTESVPNATSSVTITPTTTDLNAKVTVNGVAVTSTTASGAIALAEGATTTITTVVTAQDGSTTKTYTLAVTRAKSSNAGLSSIMLTPNSTLTNTGTVGSTTTYTTSVPNATASVTVTPIATDVNSTIKVNGVTVASGTASASIPVAVGVGATTITTIVTAQDGTTTGTYLITITRAPSNIATLSTIKLTPNVTLTTVGTVGTTTSYTATETNATTSVTVTPTTTDPTATVKVNGTTVASGAASASVALGAEGSTTTITTIVTAQDGSTTHTYSIAVTRAPSSDATLSNLVPNSGTLTPAFASATTTYNESVPNTTTTITVTPTAHDGNTHSITVTANAVTTTVASGAASPTIALGEGIATVITVTVTAQDGTTTATYTLMVTRAASSVATLSSLAPSTGSIAPAFASGTTSYTESVANATASIAVTPTTTDANAKVTVNGVAVTSGSSSASIALPEGATTTISTVVTAQDGSTTKTYSIAVTRAKSTNAALTSIALTPAAALTNTGTVGTTTSYTASVSNTTTSVTVTPVATDANATIKVNSVTVASGTASGSIALVVGANTITTVVTAQDGTTTHTYSITVTRAPSTNALLTSIKLTPASTLTNTGTVGTTTNYTTPVLNANTSVTVTAVAQDPTATIKVNGVTVASGAASTGIHLNIGANTITTVVTAQDGVTTHTYIITATRASGPVMSLFQQAPQEVSVTKPVDTVAIENDGVMVHQGVSPNGDGINDILTIDGISAYPENRFTIIDRNGTLVYEVKGYDNTSRMFDGHSNINGRLQQPGTYFYSLDYVVNGKTKHKTGFIILKY